MIDVHSHNLIPRTYGEFRRERKEAKEIENDSPAVGDRIHVNTNAVDHQAEQVSHLHEAEAQATAPKAAAQADKEDLHLQQENRSEGRVPVANQMLSFVDFTCKGTAGMGNSVIFITLPTAMTMSKESAIEEDNVLIDMLNLDTEHPQQRHAERPHHRGERVLDRIHQVQIDPRDARSPVHHHPPGIPPVRNVVKLRKQLVKQPKRNDEKNEETIVAVAPQQPLLQSPRRFFGNS